MTPEFHFQTQMHLVRLLGRRAKNPAELLSGIKAVPQSSIYYHTHRYLQQHHYLSPEPPNDFAYWLTSILGQRRVGEALAAVDTVSFKSMEELRAKFITILETHVAKGMAQADCPEGNEFHFMACLTFILPTPHVAHNVEEFVEVLDKVSVNSIYFHIFEARLRLQRDENDFSAWLNSIGQPELAKELIRLDPYTMTLEGLVQKIKKAVKKYARH